MKPNKRITLAYRAALLAFSFGYGVGAVCQQPPAGDVTPVSTADARCGACHGAVLQSYLSTPMANASGLAAERPRTGTFEHKASGMTYALSLQGPDLVLSYREANDAETAASRQLEYFLGSGHLGLTYLYSLDGYLFESPLAYYSASQSLDLKPGLEAMTQAPPALPVQAECLRCHMSGVQHSDPGTINHYRRLPFLHAGITCESCHGDTQSHVATGGKAAVINPAKLSAGLRDSICISCHLEGDVSVERAGRSALDFKPGDSISDYVAYFVYGGQAATKRGVSEVEQLSLSKCKRVSGDAMSCMSCHDPHYTPQGAKEKAAFYRAKCLACHTGDSFATAHHPENPDCTSCHMPRTGAENIAHVAWTDHRILKYPEAPDAPAKTAVGNALVPVFSPGATARDAALAYYKAWLDGNAALQAKAMEELEAIKPTLSGDDDALVALGILSQGRGDYQQAQELFEAVVRRDPLNLIAISNLGTLLAKSGEWQAAISLWQPAFERNEDVVGLAKNLARAECAAGDTAAARATLHKTLRYSPGVRDVRQLMTQLQDCGSQK